MNSFKLPEGYNCRTCSLKASDGCYHVCIDIEKRKADERVRVSLIKALVDKYEVSIAVTIGPGAITRPKEFKFDIGEVVIDVENKAVTICGVDQHG